MKATIATNRAHELLPLLRSIGEEILERASRVEHLTSMIDALSTSRAHQDEVSWMRADLAMEKRELRHAEEELDRLGCTVQDLAPLTFRIQTDESDELTWRLGDQALRSTELQDLERSA